MKYKITSAANFSLDNMESILGKGVYLYSLSFNVDGKQYKIKNISDDTTIGEFYRMAMKLASNPINGEYEIDARYFKEEM